MKWHVVDPVSWCQRLRGSVASSRLWVGAMTLPAQKASYGLLTWLKIEAVTEPYSRRREALIPAGDGYSISITAQDSLRFLRLVVLGPGYGPGFARRWRYSGGADADRWCWFPARCRCRALFLLNIAGGLDGRGPCARAASLAFVIFLWI